MRKGSRASSSFPASSISPRRAPPPQPPPSPTPAQPPPSSCSGVAGQRHHHGEIWPTPWDAVGLAVGDLAAATVPRRPDEPLHSALSTTAPLPRGPGELLHQPYDAAALLPRTPNQLLSKPLFESMVSLSSVYLNQSILIV